jgi:hypothetical protein
MAEGDTGYRSKWVKWLLIYLAVGAVAYLIIYLVFLRDGGYGSSGGGTRYVIVPLLADAGRRLSLGGRRR